SNSSVTRTYVCDGKAIHCAWLSAGSCHDHQPGSSKRTSRPFGFLRGPARQFVPAVMTRILVTGGRGFIGQQLVSTLVGRGRRVRVLDIRSPIFAVPEVEYVAGSVLDPNLVDACLRDVDQVFHLAALPGMWMPRKSDFHAVNCRGTKIVISAARKRGVARMLHCSTESILFRRSPSDDAVEDSLLPARDMPGPYTRSKMLAEQLALQAARSGFPDVIGTPTMPIGPHDHHLTPPTAMLRHFLG